MVLLVTEKHLHNPFIVSNFVNESACLQIPHEHTFSFLILTPLRGFFTWDYQDADGTRSVKHSLPQHVNRFDQILLH